VSDDQKKQLQTQLWNIANELRGKMNADEFRDYILGFIFYKYLSEKMTLYANWLLMPDGFRRYDFDLDETDEQHNKIIDAVKKEAIDNLGYFLKPSELFHRVAIQNDQANLTEQLEKILNNIEQSTLGHDSEDDFDKLFSELDLNATRLGKTVSERNKLISRILNHLDKIDFKLEDAKVDILGDAYEYLIGQFASGAGKKAGEFYTPQEVSKILARIVTDGKERLKNVYDPTCGSGSLLLRVAKYVKDVGHFYGQEMNNTTYNLARMNMLLHDVRYDHFDIRQEDTLEHPQHIDQRFEAIVANPPFSAKWSADTLFLQDDRFSQYGCLAPSSKADYAFIEHMIYQLDENGTMATVMSLGALFRERAEEQIRKYLIKDKNYLDAVIVLPPNLFFGTPIPACIMVFKKCRENPEDVIFIDASGDYEKVNNQNKLRDRDIQKIIETYNERKTEDKYSYVAPMNEIAENSYNLNITRYVNTLEEEEPFDLNEVTAALKQVETREADVNATIAKYTKELGIDSPF